MPDRKHALARVTEDVGAALQLPASAEKVDKELVDRSVDELCEIAGRTVARGQDEIGQYLLKEYFDNDPALYFASGPAKHASLKKLLDRCESMELPMRRTFLLSALRLAAAAKQLPKASPFVQLPPSHRVELLRVKAPEKREQLATRALESKLSVQRLRTLVDKTEQRSKERPGRGRLKSPGVLRAVETCLRTLRDEDTGKLLFRRSDVSQMTDEQRSRADAALAILEKRVADLRRILG